MKIDDHLENWKALTDASDYKKALYDHFFYLADSPGFEPVLESVMNQAIGVKVKNKQLVVAFPGGETLVGTKPETKTKAKYPKSFQTALSHHGSLGIEGARITIQDHGMFNEDDGWFEGLEDEGSELLDHGDLSKIISPMYDYSDVWIYHPTEKNPQGEPVIYYLSHEGGDIDDPQYCNIGSLFLKRFAHSLDLEIVLPVIKGTEELSFDYEAWYKGLDKNWKKVLKESDAEVEGAADAKKVRTLTDLSVDEETQLSTLEPLAQLTKITSLTLTGQHLIDYSPIGTLKKLRDLELNDCKVSDLTWITNLEHLERLELERTPVTNLTPLEGLKKLYSLSLEETPVEDLSPLGKLKKLSSLTISKTQVKSLKALNACPRMSSLSCEGTPLTFREILEFMEEKSQDIDEFSGLVTVSSDFMEDYDPAILVKSMEVLDFPVRGVETALTIKVNNTLIQTLKYEKYKKLAPRLIRAYLKAFKGAQIPPTLLENLAGNTLVCVVNGDLDEASTGEFLQNYIPQTITFSVLAFNLACYYSQKKDLPQVLKYAGRAIELGHEREKFKLDKDFAHFQLVPEFQALINKSIYPEDPEADPEGWWEKLPGDIKESLAWRTPTLRKGGKEAILGLITGEDFRVSLSGAKNLDYLRGLKHLKRLSLVECKASSLDFLETLTGLEHFDCKKDQYLDGTIFTDIKVLARLKKLTHLDLSGHKITDISPLAGLTKLGTLKLYNNPVSDLSPLKDLINLEDLTLSPVGTIDTTEFKTLVKLSHLDLNSNNKGEIISLEGLAMLKNLDHLWMYMKAPKGQLLSLKPLSGLKKLTNLFLNDTHFESIEPLYEMKSLIYLFIHSGKLTQAQKKDLADHLPGCKVSE